MKFKIMEMLTNNHFVTLENCRNAFNQNSKFVEQTSAMMYAYTVEFIGNRWMFINCDFDTKQYRDTVYDTIEEREVDNPRLRTQNELKQQFFSMYDCVAQKLYLSDFQRKGSLRTFLNNHFEPKVKMRECFLDMNQFADTVQFLKAIRLVQEQALHNETGRDLFSRVIGNDLGIDAPKKMVTKISFPHEPVANLHTILQKLGQHKNNNMFDQVVIIGEDAFGAEKKFDYESFIGDITIDVEKNYDNRYVATEVRDRLISVLGGDENVQGA